MDSAIRELLESADNSTQRCDDPAVDADELMEHVKLLKTELDGLAGRGFKLGVASEDDMALAELVIRRYELRQGFLSPVDDMFTVVFSKFHLLFTAWGPADERRSGRTRHSSRPSRKRPTDRLPDSVVAQLVQAVSSAGFRYVPRSALDEPYAGRHASFEGATWWDRFFAFGSWT